MSTASNDPQPTTILIGALGGEGGGLLTNWLVAAAKAGDLPVQSTSIPGVAQRTGATTYYLEVFPTPSAQLNGQSPVLSLYPGPGNVDVVIATELLEAGRALENGFVSPDRTTLIASTHRIYSIAEKSAMGDGIHDSDRILAAAREMAQVTMLHDLDQTAQDKGTALNAVLLGMIAGSGKLPLPDDAYEAAIKVQGVAVEANLRGFQAGLTLARVGAEPVPAAAGSAPPEQRIEIDFPAPVVEFAAHGVSRLADYQDMRYACLYLDRLMTVLAVDDAEKDWTLTREVARYLALWMSYEDVIRVADLKTRSDRATRVRTEVGAKPDEPVHVTEFLKPGVEEVASLLPPGLGAALSNWAARRDLTHRLNIARRVRTDTVFGFLQLWSLAKLRFWRPRTFRFAQEQALIEQWLAALVALAPRDYAFAVELVECANILKGYGETSARGHSNFVRVFETIVSPAISGGATDANSLKAAREAALADPEGAALGQALTV